VDSYSWRWIFYINVPLGILAAIMTVAYVRNAAHQERAKRIDVLGIVLLTLCVGSLQWMLERGERYDWFDSRFVTALAVTAVVSGVLLIWRELTVDEPVIDFRVLKSRQLLGGVTFAAALGLALYGSIFVLPVFLQSLHGFSAWQTGMVILPGALAAAVTMAVVGRNARRLDARMTVIAGALLFLVSMWQLSNLTITSGADDMFWPLIWRGAGLGLIFVPLTNAAMADLSVRDLAQGTGMFNLFRQLGGSLGIAIMATLLTRFTRVKEALLAGHVTAYDPDVQSRLHAITQGLIAHGTNAITAQRQALAVLEHQITAQASVLAFSRIYLLSGIILVAGLPLLLLFKTGRARGSGGPVH
jgi:DHA2 family multidrug resistance protein